MFKLKFFSFAGIMLTVLLLSGCGKFRRGCTDPTALNFDDRAFRNDGSCKYTSPKKVGDIFGGGIVFCVFDGGVHGLIAAEVDQNDSIPWNNNIGLFAGKTFPDFGTGEANTSTIVGAQGQGFYAAKFSKDLIYNGHDDWFLPSANELDTMYVNLKLAGLGNLADANYWTSTEVNQGEALTLNFAKGVIESHGKQTFYRLRAIRTF